MSRRRRAAAAGLAAVLLAVPVACGESGQPGGPGSAATGSPVGPGGPRGEVTVLAAASLTEAFTTIGEVFRADSGVTVTYSFGSSATLATQVVQGAPADVFAAASPATMQTVTDAGTAAGAPQVFATNTLQIAVPEGNPGGVTGLADFADADRRLAVCAPQVPCGAAARTVFARAGVDAKPDTEEADVKATLAKVAAGEVDAALVYRTDVAAAADRVDGIEFAEAAEAVNAYPIVALRESDAPDQARAFVAFVRSAAAQEVLTRAGFGRP